MYMHHAADNFLPLDQSLEQLGVGLHEILVLRRLAGNNDFRVSPSDPTLLRLVASQVRTRQRWVHAFVCPDAAF